MITFITSTVISCIVFVLPFAFGHVATGQNQAMLFMLMAGVSLGFIYSIGFQPEHRLIKYLLGPVLAWILMGLGSVYFVLA